MGRYPQKSNSHGSLKDLQVAINVKKKYLDAKISKVKSNWKTIKD